MTPTLSKQLAMAVILLIAAYMRIYQLGEIPYGLIPDEAIRGYDAYSLLQTGADSFGEPWPLFLRSFEDYTPALYSYLSVPFMAIFNLSVLSTRLASAVVGVFTVALTYQFARRTFGDAAALIAALLLAMSPWHILASRTGTEWNLLAFGPILTIMLAYRGLTRPRYLIAAGVAAGISLYGYAPIKAFLPILGVGFVLFYWRALMRHWQAALVAGMLLIGLALPVYLFSFTPEGLIRLENIYQGTDPAANTGILALIENYFSYFSPNFFILSQYDDPTLHINIVH